MVFKWVLLFIQQELTILFFDFFFSLKIDSFAIWENMNYYQFSYLLSGVKWKSLSRVQLCDPMDCVHGILQARILEWVTFPFSRGSSQPRDRTQVSPIEGGFLPAEPQGKPKNTGVGSLSFLQQIFLTQESNRVLFQLSYQGSQSHNTGNPEPPETGPCGHWRYKHKLS